MHLTDTALSTLMSKGVAITDEEREATLAAILLHDIGHGPFSHALEDSIIDGINHEDISLMLMNRLNGEFSGRLDMAIEIFRGTYFRSFLHDLISGQMDMDRMDYLRRDSFFTGVIEGSVGSDRLIRMLAVVDNSLVIEEKGIYSLEKFLIARRLMYWQVYMHKTVLSSECLLVNILKRAKQLALQGKELNATPALSFFLYNSLTKSDLTAERMFTPSIIAANFTRLDDSDILVSSKYWVDFPDRVLSSLAGRLLRRDLFAIELGAIPFPDDRTNHYKQRAAAMESIDPSLADYLVFRGSISNLTYAPGGSEVKILMKNGETRDIAEVSDMFEHRFLSESVTKYYLCYPKECS